MAASPWMTSEQAARRLGVKPETLYAYVSRGLIRSERVPGQRRSRFLRADVERHAARSRVGGRAGALEVVLETQLTLLEPEGRLWYRGWDVADAVASSTFEAVASWLWTGERDPAPFEAAPGAVDAARHVLDAAGELAPVDCWRIALPVLRATDPLRGDRRPSAVRATGRSMLATLVECLPLLGPEPAHDRSIAARLWPRLTAAPPSRRRIAVLDAALVLLADHELAASTLAVRVAASTWADPYLVVGAGLSALGGPLHGGASEGARALLRDAGTDGSHAAAAIGRRLEAGQRIPGFGHRVYEHVDPRVAPLLDRLSAAGDTPAAVEPVSAIVADRGLPFPNVDFALAAMGEAYDMIEGATESVFATARIVGWLAHAIEEYEHALRFRTRAAYVGPRP
ncbi:MAG TPA: citrate/2-methylcitrate synthase [Acidimicrobiales bacterium]|nr:citrate/2-methylcitrate synthase [Acidimicrobiales bacterium]